MSTEYVVIFAILVPAFWFLSWVIMTLEEEIHKVRLQAKPRAAVIPFRSVGSPRCSPDVHRKSA